MMEPANLKSRGPARLRSRVGWCLVPGFLAVLISGCAERTSAFYPLGIYSVKTADLPVAKGAGFNLVSGPARMDYLDAAQANGLKVLGEPPAPKAAPSNARSPDLQVLDRHPALWAWYLIDEPDLNLVPPEEVTRQNRRLVARGARKPAALVLCQGPAALDYAGLTRLTFIDRYPVPWFPLEDFGKHVRMTRLALGKRKPLIAVIQAFDWSYYRDVAPEKTGGRPPNYRELRWMTYCALAERANGLFYYAFDAGGWKMEEHLGTWLALYEVVREVRERLPLFQAEHIWWGKDHQLADQKHRFNSVRDFSVKAVHLKVRNGNAQIPKGDYVLALNASDRPQVYGFSLPHPTASEVPVLDERRSLKPNKNWLTDQFEPYAIHVYGPVASKDER